MPNNVRIVNSELESRATVGVAHEQVTVSTTALDLAAELTAGALNENTTHVKIQATGADLRYTLDGTTDPTATKGFLLTNGTEKYIPADVFADMKGIRDASTDVVLEIQEFIY